MFHQKHTKPKFEINECLRTDTDDFNVYHGLQIQRELFEKKPFDIYYLYIDMNSCKKCLSRGLSYFV